ncbi:CRISPR-associated endonuclease Cas2 [Patescibacteria group bacterium]
MSDVQKNNKVPVKKIVLTTIATVGLVSVAVMAPNALQALKMFSNNTKYNKKQYLSKVIQNLLNKELIKFETKNNKKFVRLTEKGEKELAKYELGDLKIKKPKRWDKKWRVVMFDIKETRKGTRTILRNNLNRLGFVRLQNSVWIFPYDCEELIVMLKSNLFLGKDVLYMTVDKLENDKWLKEVFGLV